MPAQSHPRAALSGDPWDAISSFDGFGSRTETSVGNSRRYFVNEFWTSAQRAGHRLHEISYRACFKPQLPEFFIRLFTRRGETVYDPFMGRGTTPLQASLMGRDVIGNDINPLSTYLVEPRFDTPSLSEIRARLARIPACECGDDPMHDDLLVFYHPETLARITSIRRWLLEREPDRTDRWIRMVALNRLTGHSRGFFSVFTMPPNQAVSADSQRRINAKRNQIPPARDVDSLILKKSASLLAEGGFRETRFLFGARPAHDTPFIADDSVHLIVTSPPFLDVVDYKTDNWLRCWFAGLDPSRLSITQCGGTKEWKAMVRASFQEFERIIRHKGHVAFEVGEVRGGSIALEDLVDDAVAGLGFEELGVLVNRQMFTKTSNCWGVSNNRKGTNTNRIIVYKKI